MKTLPLLLAMMVLATSPSWAANDSREKQMLRRMQQQMQQVEQARAQAEQEKASALAENEGLQRELTKLRAIERKYAGERSARNRAEDALKATQTELESLKARVAETEAKLADSQSQQIATAQLLAQTESAKKSSESQLAGTQKDLKLCQTHNGQLYGLGREMMQKYRDKSCQDALAQAEPFTGLKKVEVENLLETWRDRLDREKLGKSD